MVISKELIIKLFLIAMSGLLIAGCAHECSGVGARFYITGWTGSLPDHGVLYRYEKGSNFSTLEQRSEADFKVERYYTGKNNLFPILMVDFTEYKTFPTGSDYKLVLDKKIEYRVYGLVPGMEESGCRLRDGKVNQCSSLSDVLLFPKECGRPIK